MNATSVTYSIVGGGHAGAGNTHLDPLFVDPVAGDFSLQLGSPAIDGGDPNSPNDPDGSRADMGYLPYEWSLVGRRYCMANANSSGTSAAITASGSPIAADDDLLLYCRDIGPNQFGFFLMSQSQDFVGLFGGSQGNLCLGAPIVRFNEDVLFSGEAGIVQLSLDFAALPQGITFVSGETWNFQYWFRDVNPGLTSNTSDALSVLFQ